MLACAFGGLAVGACERMMSEFAGCAFPHGNPLCMPAAERWDQVSVLIAGVAGRMGSHLAEWKLPLASGRTATLARRRRPAAPAPRVHPHPRNSAHARGEPEQLMCSPMPVTGGAGHVVARGFEQLCRDWEVRGEDGHLFEPVPISSRAPRPRRSGAPQEPERRGLMPGAARDVPTVAPRFFDADRLRPALSSSCARVRAFALRRMPRVVERAS